MRSLADAKRAALAKRLSTRSAGHICFIGKRSGNWFTTRIDDEDVLEGDLELFVSSHGSSLYRAPASSAVEDAEMVFKQQTKGMTANEVKEYARKCDAPLHPSTKFRFDGPVRIVGAESIVSGVSNIQEECKQLRVRLPKATRRLIKSRDAHALQLRASKSGEGPKEDRRMAKGENGKTLNENWIEVFEANEAAAKKGKAKTDEQLKEEMYERHPDKPRGITTIERIGSMRSHYNQGIFTFTKYGPANVLSHAYEEDGKTVMTSKRGRKKAEGDEKPAKKASKKAEGDEKPAKKKAPRKARATS